MSAPDVTMPSNPNQSALANTVPSSAPQMPQYSNADEQQTDTDLSGPQTGSGGGSRLQAILAAVSKVAATGLAGVPAGNRPSFAGGLGQGARAQQAAQATAQDIKFKSFDDSVRAAQLHNDDLRLQNQTDAQQNANQKEWEERHDWLSDHGYDDTTIPNSGDAVVNHMKSATTINGAVSVAPGTGINPDGNTIHVPADTQATRDAQKQLYDTFAPVYGLPSRPEGQDFVPGKQLDILQHAMTGKNPDGSPIDHDHLPGAIAAMQSQRDALASSAKTNPAQLNQLDNTLGILKANLNFLDDHAASVTRANSAAKEQGKADVVNNPTNQAGAASSAATKAGAVANATLGTKEALQSNAASLKPKADNTELNSVAFDPNYQNPDGSTGANVVMSKADAAAKGLPHYKADPAKLNATVAGFNDVQNKINMLADVANDPKRMGQVQPDVAAALMESGDGVQLGAFGTKIDMTKINANIYASNMEKANQATKDYVTAMLGAHEAITQLPRLQTFGQSSRMTQQQMEAAQKLLPQPGDAPVARQKMTALQQMLDPLRKQVPHMPGAEQIPSWLEKQGGQ
jgi:hypothetical protein